MRRNVAPNERMDQITAYGLIQVNRIAQSQPMPGSLSGPGTPSASARQRVSGAITMRFASVTDPGWTGSKRLPRTRAAHEEDVRSDDIDRVS